MQIECYDHDLMGTPDLIGRVELAADDILAIVRVTVAERSLTPTSLTWLELTRGTDENNSNLASSIGTTRNPFDTLGDIALAITARLPLPVSLEEYRRSKALDQGGISRGVADAGVRVSEDVVRLD